MVIKQLFKAQFIKSKSGNRFILNRNDNTVVEIYKVQKCLNRNKLIINYDC